MTAIVPLHSTRLPGRQVLALRAPSGAVWRLGRVVLGVVVAEEA